MTDVTTAQSSQIVQFASNNLGQRVGDGQCFALVDQALRSIGARSASDFGDITPTANYVWGREVTIDLVQAGDAIQFQNYSFQETITTRVTNPDGSSSEETETRSESRPHHSALVSSVGSHGEMFVYEQNVNGQMVVQRNALLFRTLTIGPTTSNAGGVQTTVTRTITVTGQVKFYRPQMP
ncbi:MAG: hypothetical protein KDB03_16435 [Planctomycetales bacterium]|nr:hypothetical protein [Planctomycetales bacterium]